MLKLFTSPLPTLRRARKMRSDIKGRFWGFKNIPVRRGRGRLFPAAWPSGFNGPALCSGQAVAFAFIDKKTRLGLRFPDSVLTFAVLSNAQDLLTKIPFVTIMIYIQIKENESIDKALKRFKKKFEKTGVLKQLRARTAFKKKSVKKRMEVLDAVYREHMKAEEAK